MRNTSLASLLLACLAISALADPATSPTPPVPEIKAMEASSPVVIDGILMDQVWQRTPATRVDYVDKQPGTPTEPPRMIAKIAWDEHYLYIGYETFDTDLRATAGDDEQGSANNRRKGTSVDPGGIGDFVEFFLVFEDERFFWEVHHNPANQFSDVWCTVIDPSWPLHGSSMHMWGIHFAHREWIEDEGPYRVAMAVQPKPNERGRPGTVNDPSDTDAGISGEMRLPWGSIGAPKRLATRLKPYNDAPRFTVPGPWKMSGQTMRILSVFHSGGLPHPYYHSAPTRKGSWFHTSVKQWPVYTFIEGERAGD